MPAEWLANTFGSLSMVILELQISGSFQEHLKYLIPDLILERSMQRCITLSVRLVRICARREQ